MAFDRDSNGCHVNPGRPPRCPDTHAAFSNLLADSVVDADDV